MGLSRVEISPLPPERFEDVLRERYADFADALRRARDVFEGRRVINVNSTGKGGGVAEMLRSLIAYALGAGVDARWLVIEGDPGFFRVTKRIHNNLHGAPGDGGALGEGEHETYRATLDRNAGELAAGLAADDIVILHDPQTAGLVEAVAATGATAIWRCHVGLDHPNEAARRAWDFLRPYLDDAAALVFSRRGFVWDELPADRITIVPPSIDAFSPKNEELSEAQVAGILAVTGLVERGDEDAATFTRVDGREARVTRRAEIDGGDLPENEPWVVQVSRWDRLKDPLGVVEGFARHVAPRAPGHLVLAGPAVADVADDPEGAEVLEEVRAARADLPDDARSRVHLVTLPMDDGEENAAMVNALQRRADVVVQKSLAEGFGLTVAEAMWKGRPVVAGRIGGIQDQIVHGETGLLIDDPADLDAFGAAVTRLLQAPDEAARMGEAAYERVRTDFLAPRHLTQYLELVARLSG